MNWIDKLKRDYAFWKKVEKEKEDRFTYEAAGCEATLGEILVWHRPRPRVSTFGLANMLKRNENQGITFLKESSPTASYKRTDFSFSNYETKPRTNGKGNPNT